MPDTLVQCLADARLIYNDIPLANDPEFGAQTLRIVNKIHSDLCEEYAVQIQSYDVPLVNGTREYAISENYKTIYSANYLYSANTQPIYLYETSVDELDLENPAWRTTFTGVPFRYYEYASSTSSPVVGFDPIPSTSTSAGYPTVRLFVGVYTPLTATDYLPSTIKNSDVYIDGIAYQWARLKNKLDLAERKALYDQSRADLGTYLMRKQRRLMPRVYPFMSAGNKAI